VGKAPECSMALGAQQAQQWERELPLLCRWWLQGLPRW
jgi:hypothetical protein